MSMAVVFRCDVGSGVGLGHLMRCREMARFLTGEGVDCAMVGPEPSWGCEADEALFAIWEPVATRSSAQEDARRVTDLCSRMGARHAVIDDYRADPDFQKTLRAHGLRWLQQFDASTDWRFCCDVLVNASPYEQRGEYLHRLDNPAGTETLFGPAFAVVRPAFRDVALRGDGRPVRRILVGFGGGDDLGAVALAVEALAGRLGPDVRLVVVSGKDNPRRSAIEAALHALPEGQAELHVAPDDMAGLMAGCDLAVIGGGTMSYEAAICGLPTVLVSLAANQENPCRGWQALSGAVWLGQVGQVDKETLFQAVSSLVSDGSRRRDMAARGRAAVDGKGVERLAVALLEGNSG